MMMRAAIVQFAYMPIIFIAMTCGHREFLVRGIILQIKQGSHPKYVHTLSSRPTIIQLMNMNITHKKAHITYSP